MRLPELDYSDSIQRHQQTTFYGLNHREGAGDGAIWDMRNMCSNEYPILATRPKRYKWKTLTAPNGIFAWDGIAYIDGTGFYFNGVKKADVSNTKKTMAGIGAYIVILPDKAYYNVDSDEFGYLGKKWTGHSISFMNGTIYDVAAEANTLQVEGVTWSDYFKIGDAVTISGCTSIEANNKTPIIREIDGDKLRFYENTFKLSGDMGLTNYTEFGDMAIEREIPDMDYLFENENRLWGAKGNEIYVSKLGDIFNWNVFDGLSTDAYNINVGTAGKFAGAGTMSGYSIFFKPDMIYKMYGQYPSNYQLMGSATLGMPEGSGGSIAIAGETMYYHSRAGFAAYTGGVPNPINTAFGQEKYFDVVAGSDGLKYYASAKTSEGTHILLVYDTQNSTWYIEDEIEAVGFTYYNQNLYMLAADGAIWIMGAAVNPPEECTIEPDFQWHVEFGDITNDDSLTKNTVKIQLRIELEPKASAEVYLMYDSSGKWEKAGQTMTTAVKKSYYLPVLPHRCDHYKIMVKGKGGAKIYSITTEYSIGSQYRSTKR